MLSQDAGQDVPRAGELPVFKGSGVWPADCEDNGMGLDKLTIKLQEALQSAQRLASKSAHPELRSAHVLLELLQQEKGIVVPLLEKAGVELPVLKAGIIAALDREPRMEGASAQPQISYGLRATLEAADEARMNLGDDFLSVEHFLLGAMEAGSPAGKLLEEAGMTREALDQALQEVRGSQKVTDEDPEGKYQALEKYGTGPVCARAFRQDRFQSSDATRKFDVSFRCFRAGPRTTRFLSGSLARARPPS